MKNLILISLALPVFMLIGSCSMEDDTDGENLLLANINGKDSVFTISRATLQSFPGYKRLTILTTLSSTSFDLYIHAPEISANNDYPVANPLVSPHPEEFSCCYYRILQPHSIYTARAYVSTVSSPEYKTSITEINRNLLKGRTRFKAIDQGYFTSGEVIIDASFSTNRLEYIDDK